MSARDVFKHLNDGEQKLIQKQTAEYVGKKQLIQCIRQNSQISSRDKSALIAEIEQVWSVNLAKVVSGKSLHTWLKMLGIAGATAAVAGTVAAQRRELAAKTQVIKNLKTNIPKLLQRPFQDQACTQRLQREQELTRLLKEDKAACDKRVESKQEALDVSRNMSKMWEGMYANNEKKLEQFRLLIETLLGKHESKPFPGHYYQTLYDMFKTYVEKVPERELLYKTLMAENEELQKNVANFQNDKALTSRLEYVDQKLEDYWNIISAYEGGSLPQDLEKKIDISDNSGTNIQRLAAYKKFYTTAMDKKEAIHKCKSENKNLLQKLQNSEQQLVNLSKAQEDTLAKSAQENKVLQDQLKDTLAKSAQETKGLQDELATQTQALDELQALSKAQKDALAKSAQEKTGLQDELATQTQALDKLKKEHEDTLAKSAQEKTGLQDQLATQIQALDELRKVNTDLKNQWGVAQTNLQRLTDIEQEKNKCQEELAVMTELKTACENQKPGLVKTLFSSWTPEARVIKAEQRAAAAEKSATESKLVMEHQRKLIIEHQGDLKQKDQALKKLSTTLDRLRQARKVLVEMKTALEISETKCKKSLAEQQKISARMPQLLQENRTLKQLTEQTNTQLRQRVDQQVMKIRAELFQATRNIALTLYSIWRNLRITQQHIPHNSPITALVEMFNVKHVSSETAYNKIREFIQRTLNNNPLWVDYKTEFAAKFGVIKSNPRYY